MKTCLLVTALALSPVLAVASPITSLTIHSEENRANCNDGYTWSTIENMCLADNGR